MDPTPPVREPTILIRAWIDLQTINCGLDPCQHTRYTIACAMEQLWNGMDDAEHAWLLDRGRKANERWAKGQETRQAACGTIKIS